jgi:hypothetical protein
VSKAFRRAASLLVGLVVLGAMSASTATSLPDSLVSKFSPGNSAAISGAYEWNANLGTGLTECPQAGIHKGEKPRPLDRRRRDEVEGLSTQGDDERANQDYACFPQNEVSVDTNPTNDANFVIGANDYRLGTGSSGFYATTNGGQDFYDGIIPFPTAPPDQSRGEGLLPSGGDPVVVFDRAGIVYYSQIAFYRGDDTNGVFVARSTNGGFTWSRACAPDGETDEEAVCGGVGDVRQPADGRVVFDPDDDLELNFSVPFHDKEYMAAGPRPAGVDPVCYTPISREPTACDPDVVGVDRIYVTWTKFTPDGTAEIHMSHSDDQARSWSPPQPIFGNAPFCEFGTADPNDCDQGQASVPTVSPETGHVYVAFENFNTPDENQYLVVRSADGGETWQGPWHITSIYDLNFPRALFTRPDCDLRGAQAGRIVYTNSCFRSNAYGNIVVDKRGGPFADDLYVVVSDNRNGTAISSNADIFFFKSVDGGRNWVGPTRVNNDASIAPEDRDCGRFEGFIPVDDDIIPGFPDLETACGGIGDFGNDQWWPWVDIDRHGMLHVAMKDRRLDTGGTDHEWPTSRSRAGNYLVWTWGAQCQISASTATPGSRCVSAQAALIPQPTEAPNPGIGPQPGQDQSDLPFRNFKVSDVPSNYDYSFRAGLFAGDYENVAAFNRKSEAVVVFTDARNGRSSRQQPGRNPICEQSDVWFDLIRSPASTGGVAGNVQPFYVTPCPAAELDD